MTAAMKFYYYNKPKKDVHRTMSTTSAETRIDEFKRRFRRSGSLGLPFFPEEDMRSIKADLILPVQNEEEECSELLTIIVKTTRSPDSLSALLAAIPKEVSVKHLESRDSQDIHRDNWMDVLIEMELDIGRHSQQLINGLRARKLSVEEVNCTMKPLRLSEADKFADPGTNDVTAGAQWFPRSITDLDICSRRVVMYGSGLDADHPGFTDDEYRKRRMMFADIALNYKQGQPIPRIEYTQSELTTWGTIYRKLRQLHKKYACQEFLDNFELLERYCGYSENNVPQLDDVCRFLKNKTGFRVRPVAGYLSARDFLAGLAFRVFNCTQYVRHHADPFYTPEPGCVHELMDTITGHNNRYPFYKPEPDCVHELMGHMALFADPDFAQFSQEIGLASLGASEEDLSKLATLYFFSIEFGLCSVTPPRISSPINGTVTTANGLHTNCNYKVYGAGLLSSIAELQHAVEGNPEILRFDPDRVVQQECLITTFQTAYFYTKNFEEAQQKLRMFTNNMNRPFVVRYNAYTESVEVLNNKRSLMLAVNSLRSDINLLSGALHNIL